MKRVGLLTGGGDCPGLNPVIRAVVRKADIEGITIIGIRNGWKGLVENTTIEMELGTVSGILPKGGTILGTSRTNPFKDKNDLKKLKANYKALHLDGLIAVGGEDTLGVAARLFKEEGLSVVGVPKTIDNDLSQTDYTFGFDTAINIATEAIDRLHTTAESHHRIMVIETMGRHAGWIATEAGLAAGADAILIPEKPIDMDELCGILKNRHSRGKGFSIVVVAEGAKFDDEGAVAQKKKLDAFGHAQLGGVGQALSQEIERRTGFETRVTVLGHLQRGGTPTAFDRVLGTRFGVKAVELLIKGRFGEMVNLRGNKIKSVPIEKATARLKTLDMELYDIAKIFFG